MTSQQDQERNGYRIGDIARLTGLSADTLRYYEKIRLLPPRNALTMCRIFRRIIKTKPIPCAASLDKPTHNHLFFKGTIRR